VRALVVSDLHSNADALRCVFAKVRRKRFDSVLCLGDFVGYGAQPNQVLDSMRTLRGRKIYIRGNHDRVASGLDDANGFDQRRAQLLQFLDLLLFLRPADEFGFHRLL